MYVCGYLNHNHGRPGRTLWLDTRVEEVCVTAQEDGAVGGELFDTCTPAYSYDCVLIAQCNVGQTHQSSRPTRILLARKNTWILLRPVPHTRYIYGKSVSLIFIIDVIPSCMYSRRLSS